MVLDKMLEEIERLSIEDKELFIDIVNRRLAEEKRDAIANSRSEAISDYKSGNVEKGDVEDLLKGIS